MQRMIYAGLLLATFAWPVSAGQASTNTPSAPQQPSTAAAATTFEEPELKAFAVATAVLQDKSKTPDEQRAVIEQAGLSVERYNQISEAVRRDPEVLRKVQVLMQPAVSPSNPQHSPLTVPPPERPTTGDGAALLQVLDKICVPAVESDREIAKLAPAAGFKRNARDGAYHKRLGPKPYEIVVAPRGANQAVCSVQVRYKVDAQAPLRQALHVWALTHTPEMKQVRSDVVDGPDGIERTTLSWEGGAQARTYAMVFVEMKTRDGMPLDPGFDQATLLYSVSPPK